VFVGEFMLFVINKPTFGEVIVSPLFLNALNVATGLCLALKGNDVSALLTPTFIDDKANDGAAF